MAGVAVGVVTAGDVSSQPAPASGKLSSPAAWSYIWTGCAVAYLLGVYIGMINIRRGE